MVRPVPPRQLDKVLAHIREGNEVWVASYTKPVKIDAKVLKRFEKAGHWLLREDGDGYRLRSGTGSVYLAPGHLVYQEGE